MTEEERRQLVEGWKPRPGDTFNKPPWQSFASIGNSRTRCGIERKKSPEKRLRSANCAPKNRFEVSGSMEEA